MKFTRRDHLTAIGGALLAGAASPAAASGPRGQDDADAEVMYGHGQVWNRDLPGLAGELKLSFDLRVNLETGVGFGTAHDPVHSDGNVHFAITSTDRKRVRGGEMQYLMNSEITAANNPVSVGLPVRIVAQTRGDTTAIAIAIGDQVFRGAGLVVIAIIAVLISFLSPAIHK